MSTSVMYLCLANQHIYKIPKCVLVRCFGSNRILNLQIQIKKESYGVFFSFFIYIFFYYLTKSLCSLNNRIDNDFNINLGGVKMSVKRLFDSRGQHIANFRNGQLHAPTGENIGHYREREEIFIDMNGRYLGEIIKENRLMYNNNSGHRHTNFGVYGNYGNIGNYGNPGNYGSIGFISGYSDVDL